MDVRCRVWFLAISNKTKSRKVEFLLSEKVKHKYSTSLKKKKVNSDIWEEKLIFII